MSQRQLEPLQCGRPLFFNHPRQVAQIVPAMFDAFQRCPRQAVIGTDWRPIHVFAPKAAEALSEMLSTTNQREY